MAGYAAETDVPAEKTKTEIERTLQRYKADQFVSGWSEDTAFVMFRCRERTIRFTVPLPRPGEEKFTHTDRGKKRAEAVARQGFEQAVRSTWRRLLLCIKAKLESVDSGIETFEEAFLAQIVLPGNATVGDRMRVELPKIYASGKAPADLLALPPHKPEKG